MNNQILMNNEPIRVEGRDGKMFEAAATFVKHAGGDYTFVITASPDVIEKLVSNRADLGRLARTFGTVPVHGNLDYIERQSDGACHRVHLKNLEQFSGTGGEPEHTRSLVSPVSSRVVEMKLGGALMPVARGVALPVTRGEERAEVQEVKAKPQISQKIVRPKL